MLATEPCSSRASLTRCAVSKHMLVGLNAVSHVCIMRSQTPVQKWQTSDIQSMRTEKNKHVHIEVGGPNAASLHFHAGSKEVADAIMAKLEEARAPTEESPPAPAAEPQPVLAPPRPQLQPERPRSSATKSVHFDNSEPVIIPPREADDGGGDVDGDGDGDVDVDQEVLQDEQPSDAFFGDGEGERAVVLYDFVADGEDEMTVHEGETLLVLERDTDEWWKCRNAKLEEGVVPANYLEVSAVHVLLR